MSQLDMLPPGGDPSDPAEIVAKMRRELRLKNPVDAFSETYEAARNSTGSLAVLLGGVLLPEVQQRLIDAPREDRYGTDAYAVITTTPTGTRIRLWDYPSVRVLAMMVVETLPFIILDCETTGLHPENGDRVVSVSARAFIAMMHPEGLMVLPTAEARHFVVNPGRPSSPEALGVHRLDEAELAGKPAFGAIAADLRSFLMGEGWYEGRHLVVNPLIIAHNAPFDVGFLDMEFERVGQSTLSRHHNFIDTEALVKMLWPGASSGLDALCGRFGVDRGTRDLGHEASHDVELLARVLPHLLQEAVSRNPNDLSRYQTPRG